MIRTCEIRRRNKYTRNLLRKLPWTNIIWDVGLLMGAVISLICDKSVTTHNLAFLSYWCRKKRVQTHF